MMGIFRPDVGAACRKHYKKLLQIKATCRKILKEWGEWGEEAWRYHRLLDRNGNDALRFEFENGWVL